MPAPRGVVAPLALFLLAAATVVAAVPPQPANDVAWAPSGGLVLAEVVTGGASASDEYIEIANAGRSSVDLGGCEVVYVTASGATTTRKAAFSASMVLSSNEHVLIANSAGVFPSVSTTRWADSR